LLTPAAMYPLALFQSQFAIMNAAAMATIPKMEPIQIRARRFRLVIANSYYMLRDDIRMILNSSKKYTTSK